MLEKLDRITVAIDMKMDGSVLDVKSSLKMVVLSFFSEMDWGTYIVSITKTACKKLGDCSFYDISFLKVGLFLYKSTIQLCME